MPQLQYQFHNFCFPGCLSCNTSVIAYSGWQRKTRQLSVMSMAPTWPEWTSPITIHWGPCLSFIHHYSHIRVSHLRYLYTNVASILFILPHSCMIWGLVTWNKPSSIFFMIWTENLDFFQASIYLLIRIPNYKIVFFSFSWFGPRSHQGDSQWHVGRVHQRCWQLV
jgi:hypothetical protein